MIKIKIDDILLWFFLFNRKTFLCRGLRPHPQKKWRRDECARSMGLMSSKQIRICKGNMELMPFVEESIRLVKDECKEQFHQRTWDCSSIEKAPSFGFDLRSGLLFQTFYSLFLFRD